MGIDAIISAQIVNT